MAREVQHGSIIEFCELKREKRINSMLVLSTLENIELELKPGNLQG